MKENLNFQVTSKLDSNDMMQFMVILGKKKLLLFKVVLIINIFNISISLIIDLYNYMLGDFSRLPFMIFCLIFLIVFSLCIINFNKIQLKSYSRKYLGKNKEVYSVSKLCFYDTYYTVEGNDTETNIFFTMSYDEITYFVVKKNLIVFGDNTKAKSVSCIKQNEEFQIGTSEELVKFLNNKINR